MYFWLRGAGVALRVFAFSALTLCDCEAPRAADQIGPTVTAPLAPNDLSILFPVPTQQQDLDRFIAVQDLSHTTPEKSASTPVFPPDFFGQIVALSGGPAGVVAGTSHRISLPTDLQKLDAWFVAGIRIDAGAPGLSPAIIDQYGQAPQIRLILQPVTKPQAVSYRSTTQQFT